jgi:hypothetical protein
MYIEQQHYNVYTSACASWNFFSFSAVWNKSDLIEETANLITGRFLIYLPVFSSCLELAH